MECRLKRDIHGRAHQDTISWVRDHRGIPDNKKADVRATLRFSAANGSQQREAPEPSPGTTRHSQVHPRIWHQLK